MPASQRSDVPAAPAVRKSSVAGGPKGSFPLQLHKVSPYMKLIKKTGIAKAAGEGLFCCRLILAVYVSLRKPRRLFIPVES